jgi:hypothetical protein
MTIDSCGYSATNADEILARFVALPREPCDGD